MEKESFTFIEASEKDFAKIASFFKSQNYGLVEERMLRWKYLDNPFGKGRIFLILDDQKNIHGTLGYIPRRIYGIKSGMTEVMDAVDLYFSPETRGKKLFPKFKRFAMGNLNAALIAFPNKRSEKVTIEIGWEHVAPIQSWFYPLLPNFRGANVLSRFMSLFYRVIDPFYTFIFLGRKRNPIELKEVRDYRTDFSRLPYKKRPGHSQQYLNWRYVNNPLQEYKLFELFFDGKLIGYAVVKIEKESVIIYDIFTEKREKQCFRKIIDYFKNMGFTKVIIKSIGLKYWNFGFIKFSSEISLISFKLSKDQWLLLIGDSDW